MLPEDSPVFRPKGVPTLLEGDEPGIEGVTLGPGHDLAPAAAMEWPHEMDGMRDLQRFEIRPDRRTAQPGKPGEAADIELAAAPGRQEVEQRQEALSVPNIEAGCPEAGPRTARQFAHTRKTGALCESHGEIGGPDARILILLDANGDCPGDLGPTVLKSAREACSDRRFEVVLAKREYESWFVAAAESLPEGWR